MKLTYNLFRVMSPFLAAVNVSLTTWYIVSVVVTIWACFLKVTHAQVNSLDIPDVVSYTGKMFNMSFGSHPVYGDPGVSVEIIVSSKSGGYRLPSWLWFNDTTRSLSGVPFTEDEGTSLLTIKAHCKQKLNPTNSYTSECRDSSHSFQLEVIRYLWSKMLSNDPVVESLPESATFLGDTVSASQFMSTDYICEGTRIMASLVLCASSEELNSKQRLNLMLQLSSFLSIPVASITLERASNSLLKAVENGFHVISAGPGSEGTCYLNHNIEIFWWLPCSTVKHFDDFVRVLQHNVDGGRLNREISINIVGWYVASSNSLLTRRNLKRRASGYRTVEPTPVFNPLKPTAVGSIRSVDLTATSTEKLSSSVLQLSLAVPVSTEELITSSRHVSSLLQQPFSSTREESLVKSLPESSKNIQPTFVSTSSLSATSSLLSFSTSPQLHIAHSSRASTPSSELHSKLLHQLTSFTSSSSSSSSPFSSSKQASTERYTLKQSVTTATFDVISKHDHSTLLPSSPTLFLSVHNNVFTNYEQPTLLPTSQTLLHASSTLLHASPTLLPTSLTLLPTSPTLLHTSPTLLHTSPTLLFASPTLLPTSPTLLHVSPTLLYASSTLLPTSPTLLSASSTLLHASPTLLQASPTLLYASSTLLPTSPTLLSASSTLLHASPTLLQASPTLLYASSTLLPTSPTVYPSIHKDTTIDTVSAIITPHLRLPSMSTPVSTDLLKDSKDLLKDSQDLLNDSKDLLKNYAELHKVSEDLLQNSESDILVKSEIQQTSFLYNTQLTNPSLTFPTPGILTLGKMDTEIPSSQLPSSLTLPLSLSSGLYFGFRSLVTSRNVEIVVSQFSSTDAIISTELRKYPVLSELGKYDLPSTDAIIYTESGTYFLPSTDSTITTDSGIHFFPSTDSVIYVKERMHIFQSKTDAVSDATDTIHHPHQSTIHHPHQSTIHHPHQSTIHHPHQSTIHHPHQSTIHHPHQSTNVYTYSSSLSIDSMRSISVTEQAHTSILPSESSSLNDDINILVSLPRNLQTPFTNSTVTMTTSDSCCIGISQSITLSKGITSSPESIPILQNSTTPHDVDANSSQITISENAVDKSVDTVVVSAKEGIKKVSIDMISSSSTTTTFFPSSFLLQVDVHAAKTHEVIKSTTHVSSAAPKKSVTSKPTTTTSLSTVLSTTRRLRARTTSSTTTALTTPAITTTTTGTTRRAVVRRPTTVKVRTTQRWTPRWKDVDGEYGREEEQLNNRPYVKKSIKVIRADQGKVLEFNIPPDVFSDIEDGDTRNLALSLELPSNQAVPSSFWLFLESAQQVMKGLPLHEDMDIKNVSVVLVARDAGGLKATDYITLQISQSPRRSFTHVFRMKFAIDFQQFMHHRKNITDLLEKIGLFFGDSGAKFITVLEVRHGSFMLSWTNNTLTHSSTCHTDVLKLLYGQMVRRDGTVRSSFSRSLGRHLNLKEVSLEPFGLCMFPPTTTTEAVTTTQLVTKVRGHGFSIWAHVILPVLIAVLVFILIILIIIFCNRRRKRQQPTPNTEKEAISNDCNQCLFPDVFETDDASPKATDPPVLPSDLYLNPSIPPGSVQVKNNLNRDQERARKSRDNRDHEFLNRDGTFSDTEREREWSKNCNRKFYKDGNSGRRYRDHDRMSGVSASSTLSWDRPNNHYLEEEAGSRSSTLKSTKSTGSDRRHRKSPPPYWQSEADPPPYRMPPPYLPNNGTEL